MSAYLLNAAVDFIRSAFSRAEVADVRPYGGEFNAAEVGKVSYSSPAIFVTVLGSQPAAKSTRMTGRHVRSVRMAAFVAVKGANREPRMTAAMAIADKLTYLLRDWAPGVPAGTPIEIGALEAEATAENLYSRKMDETGQALWLVDWTQCVRPLGPLPALYELVAIDIVDHTRSGVVPAAPAGESETPIVVTEEILFPPLDP